MESVAGATQFEMLQSLPVLLLLVVGGVATCSGALFGGIVLGLGPVIQAAVPEIGSVTLLGTGLAGVTLGANPDGVMPALYYKVSHWWVTFRPATVGVGTTADAGASGTATVAGTSPAGARAAPAGATMAGVGGRS
jgi:hypothetical protein